MAGGAARGALERAVLGLCTVAVLAAAGALALWAGPPGGFVEAKPSPLEPVSQPPGDFPALLWRHAWSPPESLGEGLFWRWAFAEPDAHGGRSGLILVEPGPGCEAELADLWVEIEWAWPGREAVRLPGEWLPDGRWLARWEPTAWQAPHLARIIRDLHIQRGRTGAFGRIPLPGATLRPRPSSATCPGRLRVVTAAKSRQEAARARLAAQLTNNPG